MIEGGRYLVFDESDIHEFTLVVEYPENSCRVSLHASQNSSWSDSAKGELFLMVEDNGNGIIFDRELKNINYSQAEHLRLLIMFIHNVYDGPKSKYKIIKEVITTEI